MEIKFKRLLMFIVFSTTIHIAYAQSPNSIAQSKDGSVSFGMGGLYLNGKYGYTAAVDFRVGRSLFGLNQGFYTATTTDVLGDSKATYNLDGGLQWQHGVWQSQLNYNYEILRGDNGVSWSHLFLLDNVSLKYDFGFTQDEIVNATQDERAEKKENGEPKDLLLTNSLGLLGFLAITPSFSWEYALNFTYSNYLTNDYNYYDLSLTLPLEWLVAYPLEIALQPTFQQYSTQSTGTLSTLKRGDYYRKNNLLTLQNNDQSHYTELIQLESEVRLFARFMPSAAKQLYVALYNNVAYLWDKNDHSSNFQYLYGVGIGWKAFDSIPFNVKVIWDKNRNLSLNLIVSTVILP